EAAYRFLVDPEPLRRTPGEAGAEAGAGAGAKDTELLEQREAFLRPDSFVFIVVLSDEDDCSLSDSAEGLSMANSDAMAPATSVCASDPDHVCCRSCGAPESEPPEGCAPLDMDDGCVRGQLARLEDQLNVRCHAPKQRFGVEGRFPTSRYIEGFSSRTLSEGRADPVTNPLFGSNRLLDSVRLLGIVGVPWQFVATDDTASAPDALQFLSPDELVSQERWPLLLANDIDGPDPHLVESMVPRPNLAAPDSTRNADPIHGHEYDNPRMADLQYSCAFALPEPRNCSVETDSCDCALVRDDTGDLVPSSPNRPLCQAEDGSYGQTQYLGKA